MSWWDEHVVPRVVDRALAGDDVEVLREQACVGLSGRVLEIGFGSGRNVGHYPAAVTEVSAVEPSDVGWRLAQPRVASSPVPVVRTGLDGQRLAAADGGFDAAVSTFTLCTIPDVRAAIGEVRRVLRPGALFHFVEHGLSPDTGVARWQRRLEPLQRRAFGGCHLTRPIDALVGEQLEVVGMQRWYLPGPRVSHPFGYVYAGTARVPA
jgi:SAM-dependent methyltransferase